MKELPELVPLQAKLTRQERDDYLYICKKRGPSAATSLRALIKAEIKKYKRGEE